jgi:hypothetical protein
MHLQPKGNTNPHNRFHVPAPAAGELLATGLYETVTVERVSVPFKPLIWRTNFVSDGSGDALLQYAPYIHASCPMCTRWQRNESSKGLAHASPFTSHNPGCTGNNEEVPAEIKKQYLALWDKWLNRSSDRKTAERKRNTRNAVALFAR